MAIDRKTIKVSISTTSSTFEDDLTAAIDAQAPEVDGWYIADSIRIDAVREKMTIIYVMEKEV